ncbi:MULTISPECIES: LysR family transcriptional regulator [unclassified Rhizobacter]|uniref:LysR family transcriptional regulator n=1 Tax=unclassified Rhizobacter TaxID=2640088 RepID=UPI000700CD34|nr:MULTISPECIES: LysR family transcriptional regulator [unclassified Rhizobacter]KQU75194.1 transcriptional regulator [Rhizobacter sp. Root29]KQW01142.1 transcriptional regulator [Rhizobacter sp. Root1238]KRB15178.1 transcriptional regulator [Rhizobacter sp. Root16D2]
MDAAQRVPAILSFVQTADRGSFAAAAKALGISGAAVSKNVASLEASLGVRLLNRTTRVQRLTNEGEAFLERARVAIDALDAAVDAVAAQRAEPSGRVRISCATHYGQSFLLPLMPGLRARHPGLVVDLDFDDRRVDLIAQGYDLALRGGRATDSGLVSRPVGRLEMVLVATPAYLAARGVPRTRADLPVHDVALVRFLSGEVSPWTFREPDGSTVDFWPERCVMTISTGAAVETARLDLGIVQVGLPQAWPLLKSGELKALFVDEHVAGDRELALHYPHRALVAPRVRATVDHLVAQLASVEALHVTRDDLRPYAAQ